MLSQFLHTLNGTPPAWLPNGTPRKVVAKEMLVLINERKRAAAESVKRYHDQYRAKLVEIYRNALAGGNNLTVSEVSEITGKSKQAVQGWFNNNEGKYIERTGQLRQYRYKWIGD